MNKKFFVITLALALFTIAPFALASSKCYACNYKQTHSNCCKPLKLLYTKYECGDCSHGYTADCRTLYKVYYYNYGAPKKSVFKTAPLGSDLYCKNGQFVKFNYTEWFECRKNPQHGNRIESYRILSAKGQPGNRVKEIPSYCPYGCNPNNGKCYEKPSYRYECSGNTRIKIDNRCNNIVERTDCSRYGQVCKNGACVTPTPKFKWICSSDNRHRIWFDYVNNKEYRREKCPQGTICSNGTCIKVITFSPTPKPAPQYEWKCQWKWFKWYSVKIDKSCGNKVMEEQCKYGCDKTTGRCKLPPIQPTPQYKWKCEWSWFNWYSVKREIGTGKKTYQEKCLKGCDKTTGRCKECLPVQPQPTQPPRVNLESKKTFCKPSEPGKIYMQFNYSNGTSLTRLYMSCGSCQRCVQGSTGAYCSGPSSGSCTRIHYNVTTRTTTSYNSSSHTYNGNTTNYNNTYSQSGNHTYNNSNPSNGSDTPYNGSSAYSYSAGASARFSSSTQRQDWQRAGFSGQSSYNVYSRSYRRPYEQAWEPPKQECIYNSDCGAGYYCAHYLSGNQCKRR